MIYSTGIAEFTRVSSTACRGLTNGSSETLLHWWFRTRLLQSSMCCYVYTHAETLRSIQLHQQISVFLKLQPIQEMNFCQTLDLHLHPDGNTYHASVTSLIVQLTFCMSVLPPITSCRSRYF